MNHCELLSLLQDQEMSLHHAATRLERLDELLHDAFIEFGRSGRAYDRSEIIQTLLEAKPSGDVWSRDFHLQRIGEGVALLTYKTAHVDTAGHLTRHTLRSSLWEQTSTGWKMRFHQGTPTSDFEKING